MFKRLRKLFSFLHQDESSTGLRGLSDFLPAAPAAPDWTLEHQVVLNRFLSSEAGCVFVARFEAVEADTARRMVKDVMHTAHSAGVADGFGQAVAWVKSLTKINFGKPSPANEGSAEDGAATRRGHEQSKTDEQVPQGEEWLFERYSP